LWRAIACDFDGTMTDEEGRLSIDALGAVREAEENGIPIIISSGRSLSQLRFLSQIMGTSGPVVAENGGVVWNPRTLTKRIQGERENILRTYRALVSKGDKVDSLNPRLRETDIVVGGAKKRELQALLDIDSLGIHILDARIATHITNIDTDKGSGLKIAASMLRIDTGEIVAIGDSENDIALLQTAGAGVAVANAYPSLKSVATLVTQHPSGKGCAEAIRRVLKKESI